MISEEALEEIEHSFHRVNTDATDIAQTVLFCTRAIVQRLDALLVQSQSDTPWHEFISSHTSKDDHSPD